jgi:hypothetical protein
LVPQAQFHHPPLRASFLIACRERMLGFPATANIAATPNAKHQRQEGGRTARSTRALPIAANRTAPGGKTAGRARQARWNESALAYYESRVVTPITTRCPQDRRSWLPPRAGVASFDIACNPPSVPRPVLVNLSLEALGHPRVCTFLGHITIRAGHACAAAIAAIRAFPWPAGMVLTNPSSIGAEDAFHANSSAPAWVSFT